MPQPKINDEGKYIKILYFVVIFISLHKPQLTSADKYTIHWPAIHIHIQDYTL